MIRIDLNISRSKFYKIFVNIFRLLLLSAIIGNIITENWLNLFISLLTLLLTYLPSLIAERNHIYIPASLQLINLIFIFASLYLGELQEYYIKFWWWDSMLHAISGIILGFLGFLLVYLLNQEEKVNVTLSPLSIAIFSFTFAVTVGVIWEIFEFTMDSTLGLNMQKSGLVDTMWDLIVDSLGALTASIIGYFYVKREGPSYFKKLTKQLLERKEKIKNSL